MNLRGLIRFLLPGASGLLFAGGIVVSGCAGSGAADHLSKVAVGRALFMDRSLSNPPGQSCASCHNDGDFFVDPRRDSPTSEGAVAGIFGNRQAPSINYMAFSPAFHLDADEQDYVGGQFWDGRAADFKDQIHFPMLNPAEMNNASKGDVVAKVQGGPLAASLRAIYGQDIFSDTNQAFDAIADAIAAFERSPVFSPFSSKYDAYLAGRVSLSPEEARGLVVFKGKAKCNNCHIADPGPDGSPPLFTDFTYDNIGLPKNPNNPFYSMPSYINPDGAAFMDHGLQATTGRPEDAGRMKVPTLRNIARTAPYFHNGIFSTLEEVVEFYNKRDLGEFPPPEFPDTMNTEELGNLGLSDQEVSDLVAFLKTLTDGFPQ
ncbi:MAG TPA: cytochrome c peroxidase [Fimbriimonadaceae bacterium]|nr:cytochrome c peroxidase [Fimbriimonadaceae bacterium]